MSTLANAMDVLRLMAHLQRDVTVTDVVAELGWPKSSASRTLSKMAEFGFLERDPVTRAYRPGEVVMEASYYFRGSRSASSLLETELDALVAETGYPSYINVLDGSETLVVQMRAGSAGALQVYNPVGTRAPAFATSMGRAILARLSDREIAEIVDPRFEVRYGHAPRTREELMARLASGREKGWFMSKGEFVKNVAGVSASVIDPASRQIYGIGIALPAQDLTDELNQHFGQRVRAAAMNVGRRIGDSYWLDFEDRGEQQKHQNQTS